jgi:hypothetical protein
MDKKIAGLLGAAAALATVNGAHAATVQATAPPPAASYMDLLQPLPNSLALLKADDARRAEAGAGGIQLAQYHHHHHHHHHHHRRPWWWHRY